jgi:hypothetical protein
MSQNTLSRLSVAQLKRAVAIKQQMERLEKQLVGILGGPDTTPVGQVTRRRRKMTAAGRAKIAAAAKERWAKVKAAKKA